ncbi:MAG: hypothetical protein JW781_05830 [Deltaproteobacteria bacterium]|nr:hypothetical protein [Candidatus Anaeroferrophillacea bacterium]
MHTFADLRDYLQISQGPLSHNIMALIRDDLSTVLGTLLHKAAKSGRPASYTSIQIE